MSTATEQLNFYQKMYSFEHRKSAANKLMERKPGHIPVILLTITSIPLKRYKLLIDSKQSVAMFIHNIKNYGINRYISPSEAIYIFSETKEMFPGSMLMSQVYETYKNDDGHLYVFVELENTFGQVDV